MDCLLEHVEDWYHARNAEALDSVRIAETMPMMPESELAEVTKQVPLKGFANVCLVKGNSGLFTGRLACMNCFQLKIPMQSGR